MPSYRAVPPALSRTPAAAWAGRQAFAVKHAIRELAERPIQHARASSSLEHQTLQVDPYIDYGRYLTPEGGVLIVYKDHDDRFRHTLWRILAWTIFTGAEASFLYHDPHLKSVALKLLCLAAVAIANRLIVGRPVEIYRRIEIRPDCMIIEGSDVFWRHFMEQGPAFRHDQKGNSILSGIYGTRFVDFLTVRRFDEHDRALEVFAAHLHAALMQQWARQQ
jgi:hypothetical protein